MLGFISLFPFLEFYKSQILLTLQMQKLTFSGHDTFICKQLWLLKGYHFVDKKKSFASDYAVVDLGVGKNMVNAIRYWLRSFGLTDQNDKPNKIADYLLGDKGVDKYLEDNGTYWLLHYLLLSTKRASIFNLIFSKFRIEKPEFTKEQLHNFLKKECEENSPTSYNENTVNNDIGVFLRSYIQNNDKQDVEEEFSGFLNELNLVRTYKDVNFEDKIVNYYKIENDYRPTLPANILLFSILNNQAYGKSINLNDISKNEGRIFATHREDIINKIESLSKEYTIEYSNTAGNQIIQFKTKPDKWKVLNDYYKK